jgi:OOP family OmpA-OmpF porin
VIRAAWFAVALAAQPGAAQAIPALSLPPAADRTADVQDGAGLWPVAIDTATPEGAVPLATIPGARQRMAWLIDAGSTTPLGLLQDLQAQIEAAGWETRLVCAAPVCGGYAFRHALDVLPLPDMYVDLSAYLYLSAMPAAAESGGAVEVLLSPSSRGLHLQISQIAAPDQAGATATPVGIPSPAAPTGLVIAAPPGEDGDWTVDRVAARLATQGRIVLWGLQFDTGSSEMPGDGVPALRALADWLAQDRGRRVALVGHSDWSGSLDSNRRLSAARAGAVADWLVARGDIDAAQVESYGAGFLTPLKGNQTEGGLAANRRVEAVLLPPG